MPRANTEQKNERVKVADSVSNAELQEVNAKPLDMLELPKASTKLDGLLDGLKEINPKLNRFAYYRGRVEAKEDKQHGITLGTTGKPLPEDASDVMKHSYLGTLGNVNANEYALEIRDKFYSRNKNDMSDEEWFKKATEDTVAQYDGMDSSYTVAFAKVIKPKLIELQREALKTKLEDITLKGEENLGKMVTQQLDELKNQPSSMGTKAAIWNNMNFTGKSMGLPRESIRAVKLSLMAERAHVGDTTLIELSKEDREGGEAGMYYSGANKIKIDGYSRIAGDFHQKKQKADEKQELDEEKEKTDPIRIKAIMIAMTDGKKAAVDYLKSVEKQFTLGDEFQKVVSSITSSYSAGKGNDALHKSISVNMASGMKISVKEISEFTDLSAGEVLSLINLRTSLIASTKNDIEKNDKEWKRRTTSYEWSEAEDNVLVSVTGFKDLDKIDKKYTSGEPVEYLKQLGASAKNRFRFEMKGRKLEDARDVAIKVIEAFKVVKEQEEKARGKMGEKFGQERAAELHPYIIFHSEAALEAAKNEGRVDIETVKMHFRYFDALEDIGSFTKGSKKYPNALNNKALEGLNK